MGKNKRSSEIAPLKTAPLDEVKSSTLATQVKVAFLAEKIVKEGWTRYDVMQYCQNQWGLSKGQSERYYKASCNSLLPTNDEEWRNTLLARNFSTLEELLKKAIERDNLKAATEVVKVLNQMMGVGGKQTVITDETADSKRTIIINFE